MIQKKMTSLNGDSMRQHATKDHYHSLNRTAKACHTNSLQLGEMDRGGSTKPLAIIAADNLVSYAMYERNHNAIDQHGWKSFKFLSKKEKKLLRMQNQEKLRSYKPLPKHEIGHKHHAMMITNMICRLASPTVKPSRLMTSN